MKKAALTQSRLEPSESFEKLPFLPRNEEGPVFREPWQAQAFAMAVNLSKMGYFSWKEWTAALAKQLESVAGQQGADDGCDYYHHWVSALEQLVLEKELCKPFRLAEVKQAWATAYRQTPHGKAVVVDDL